MQMLLTVDEASRLLGIGKTRLYELMRSGDIPSLRVGKSRRIPVREVEAWIERLLDEQRSDPLKPGSEIDQVRGRRAA